MPNEFDSGSAGRIREMYAERMDEGKIADMLVDISFGVKRTTTSRRTKNGGFEVYEIKETTSPKDRMVGLTFANSVLNLGLDKNLLETNRQKKLQMAHEIEGVAEPVVDEEIVATRR